MKYLCLFTLVVMSSCVVKDLMAPLDLKEAYVNSLSEVEQRRWLTLERTALLDSIEIDLPYQEQFSLDTAYSFSAGYIIDGKNGEILHITADTNSFFAEIYEYFNDSVSYNKAIYKTQLHQRNHQFEIKTTGKYFVCIQPLLGLETDILLSINTSPAYPFPVAGGKRADIGGYWGDPRDGGKRKHKGIDIFAKKGTPLVAVVDGMINSSRTSGLGGKQIWLSDKNRNQSVYYAHLDSQYVTKGDYVLKGDTIGTVGNTGNARTTPPHLHFGIYRNRKGAVDPLNYILYQRQKFLPPSAPKLFAGSIAEVNVVSANFRYRPSSRSKIIRKLNDDHLVRILGISGNWYHIRTSDGISGFIYKSSLGTPNEAT